MGSLFTIPHRLIQLLSILVTKIPKKSEKSSVIIFQRVGVFEKKILEIKMPLKLGRITKFQEVLLT